MTNAPNIEENLNYDQIFEEKISRFTQSYQVQYPAFIRPAPVDPTFRVLSELAMSELMVRARINAAGISQLIKFSDDLDFLFFGMRREGESTEAFRQRMRLNLNMASPAGPLEMYRSLAWAAANEGEIDTESLSVLDAYADTVGETIKIFLQPNAAVIPDMQQILKKVSEFFEKDYIKPAFDIVEVLEAEPKKVNISAKVKLAPGKGVGLLEQIKDTLAKSIQKTARLGWSLPLSWLYGQLHSEGVSSVSILTPIADVDALRNEYIALNAVILTEVAN